MGTAHPTNWLRPRLCNSSEGKTLRGQEILYSSRHQELRDFRGSSAHRIPARFVQNGP
jgi:hypothetical protein